MSADSAHPFSCPECDNHPKTDFTIFDESEVNDWLIVFPEKNLIHIHFGKSTYSDSSNVTEARFHYDWLNQIATRYPDKKFFFILDFSRKDDSESLTDEAKQIYTKIRHHPQLSGAAIYGQTHAMKFLMNILLYLGGAHTTFVSNAAEAEQVYNRFKSSN